MAFKGIAEGQDYFTHTRGNRFRFLDVKKQGNANSCWGIASAELMGVIYGRDKDADIVLSPQQLIDKVPEYFWDEHFKYEIPDAKRCYKGAPKYYFRYLTNVGICEEAAYPFRRKRNKERQIMSDHQLAQLPKYRLTGTSGFTNTPQHRQQILDLIHDQPLLGFIRVSTPAYDLPKGEVYTFTPTYDDLQLDISNDDESNLHAVLITGYATVRDVSCYEIKNTWGQKWANDGYGLVSMDSATVTHVTSFQGVERVPAGPPL